MKTDREAERAACVAYLLECASFWKREAKRLYRNPTAVLQAEGKATILEAVAKDIRKGIHA